MKLRWIKPVVFAFVLLVLANVALAVSVGPLGFQFFTPTLNALFLLPLQLAGCV